MPFITGTPVTGPGPTPGAGVIRGPFPFAFDTPGISGLPFAITAVDLLGQTFTIAGNHAALFPTSPSNSSFVVTGSTGNDGNYTVTGAVFSLGNTIVSVDAGTPILDPTADGTLHSPALGVVCYAPTVDDILLDAWIEVDTAWDTTARADIGTGVGTVGGLFGSAYSSIDMTSADAPNDGDGLLGASQPSLAGGSANEGLRSVPARVTAANPLYLWISPSGGRAESPVTDAAQGAARLYLVTSTPDAL